MDVLNLNEIVESSGADIHELAGAVFPENNRPTQALYRVLRRDAYLNELQLSRFASFLGMTVSELFDKASGIDFSDNKVLIKIGDTSSILDQDTMRLHIRRNGQIIHDTIILKKAISTVELIEYIKTINNN